MFGWFTLKTTVLDSPVAVFQPMEAKLPSQEGFSGEGYLDYSSPTWLYIERWARTQLQINREKNDSLTREETQTAALRGEIKFIKKLLDLDTRQKQKKGLLAPVPSGWDGVDIGSY